MHVPKHNTVIGNRQQERRVVWLPLNPVPLPWQASGTSLGRSRDARPPASVSGQIPVPCLLRDRGWILAAGPASDETASAASNPDALNDAVDGPTRGVPDKRPREKTVAAPSPPPSPSFTHLEGFHLPFALGIRCRSLVRSLLYVGNFDDYVL